MTSRSASPSVRPADLWSLSAAQLVRVLGLFATSMLVLTACWLLVRRFHGALQESLSLTGFLLLGGALAAALATSRLLHRRSVAGQMRVRQMDALVPRAMLTIAALISGISVSLPNTPLLTLVVFWTVISGGVLLAWVPVGLVRRAREQNSRLPAGHRDSQSPALEVTADDDFDRGQETAGELDDERAESDDALLPSGVYQRIVRARDERGAEVVYGTVRCEFAAGQRQQNVHIAFCPPLESVAEFTADQLTGSTVQVKPVLVEIFGVGLEVKLASPSKGQGEVQIQFFAFEKPTSGEQV